ncbi:MAG: phosphate propanoyltransferase [Oscillospiraceae bacterium]|nr:phosphate propanoyltransferase [Oscillospiraceae bacterium]
MGRIVKIEVSARHVHLSWSDFETLFGNGVELTFEKGLLQPGQFKAGQRVAILGPKGSFDEVAIVGPLREKTQVEISITDAKKLGLNPPIRESGDLKGSEGCKIVGSSGTVELGEGVIVPKRHLHLSFEDASQMRIESGEIVRVKVKTPERSLVFDDVVARVSYDFVEVMHIDTDEANAIGLSGNVFGEIMKKEGEGTDEHMA